MTPFVHVALHNPKDMSSDQQEKDIISVLFSSSNNLCLGDETDQKFIYPCPSLPCPIAFCALTWVTEIMCSRIACLFCRFRCFTQATSSSLKGEEDEEWGWISPQHVYILQRWWFLGSESTNSGPVKGNATNAYNI